ncbi:MAG: ParB/RepB/Spo0J family partition protein [Ignisphaera sp.]
MYKVSDVIIVRVDQLKPLPIHFSIISDEEEQIILSDMIQGGLDGIDPILVRKLTPSEIEQSKAYPEAVYEIVDGHTRCRLAKNLGWKEIKARIIECTHDEALILNYRRNRARGRIDPLRTAILVNLLLKKGYSPSKIAEFVSLPEPEILELLRASNINREILKKLLVYTEEKRRIISKDALLALLKANEDEQWKIAKAILDEDKGEVNMVTYNSSSKGIMKQKISSARFSPKELYTTEECPGCGARLRIYWLERKVEWL